MKPEIQFYKGERGSGRWERVSPAKALDEGMVGVVEVDGKREMLASSPAVQQAFMASDVGKRVIAGAPPAMDEPR